MSAARCMSQLGMMLFLALPACQLVSGLVEYEVGAQSGAGGGPPSQNVGGGGESGTGGGSGCHWLDPGDAPGPMVTGLAAPVDLAIHGDTLVWVERGWDGTGRVASLPKKGGCVTVLAERQWTPLELAVTGDSAYWTVNSPLAVMKRDWQDGVVSTYVEASEPVFDIATDDEHLYWTMRESKKLFRKPFDGTTTGTLLLSSRGLVERLDVTDAHELYVIVDGDVLAIDKTDLSAQTLLEGDVLGDVIADSETIFVARIDTQQIVAIPKATRVPEVIASQQIAPSRIAVEPNGDRMYWSRVANCGQEGGGGGAVIKGSKTGGPPETIASDISCPWTIVMDGEYIYWLEMAGGTISRARM